MEKIAIRVNDDAKKIVEYLVSLGYNKNYMMGNLSSGLYYYTDDKNRIQGGGSSILKKCKVYETLEEFINSRNVIKNIDYQIFN
jgi:hypothetical protein